MASTYLHLIELTYPLKVAKASEMTVFNKFS